MALLRPYRTRVAGFLVVSLAASLFDGISAGLLVPLFVSLQGGQDYAALPDALRRLALLFSGYPARERVLLSLAAVVGAVLLKNALLAASTFLAAWLSTRITLDLRRRGVDLMMRVRLDFLRRSQPGDLVERLLTHSSRIEYLIVQVADFFVNLTSFIALFIVLIALSWRLTVLSAVAAAAILGALTLYVRFLSRAGTRAEERSRELAASLHESIAGMHVIRAAGQEQRRATQLIDSAEAYGRANQHIIFGNYMAHILTESLGIVGLALVCVAALQMLEGQREVLLVQLVPFVYVLTRILPATKELNRSRAQIASRWPFARRIYELLNPEDKPFLRPGSRRFSGLTSGIRFENVSFAWDDAGRWALEGASFEIPAGRTTAILGPSAAGKSTVINLILRFQDPQRGAILIDDTPLPELDADSYRERIALVAQDEFIFHDTLAANLTLGADGVDAGGDRRRRADGRRRRAGSAAAEWVRHRGRTPWRHVVRWPAPAHRDCARHPAAAEHSDTRRGDECARCPIGGVHPRSARWRVRRLHTNRDRAPRVGRGGRGSRDLASRWSRRRVGRLPRRTRGEVPLRTRRGMSGPILLITHDLGAGGVQRKIADVAACLTRDSGPADATVYLLLEEGPPADPGERALFDRVQASVVRIRCRPKPVPFPLFCFWCVLTLRPERIIGFLRGPGILAVMLRRLFWWRDIRVGISDDSFPSGAIIEQSLGSAHAAALRQLVRSEYSRADWIAAASEAARTDLVRTFSVPEARVHLSRNWVSFNDAASRPATAAAAASSPAIPSGGFDLIYVGRLAPVKNLPLLVEIVHDLRDIRPSVRAVIVGGGQGLADLERQSARLGLEGHIVFAGWQRDVRPWLEASRLFCITSHHEGLPIAALEAMALGLPVIGTRYPGAEELVQDGESGFLCRDRGEFVDRIVRCLTDGPLRARLARNARELVASRYGPDNASRFVELIVRG